MTTASNDMQRIFEKVDQKLDRIVSDVKHLTVAQAEMRKDLGHHQERSRVGEESLRQAKAELTTKIEPLKRHVEGISYTLKIVGALAVIAGLVVSVIKIREAVNPSSVKEPVHEVPEVRSPRRSGTRP